MWVFACNPNLICLVPLFLLCSSCWGGSRVNYYMGPGGNELRISQQVATPTMITAFTAAMFTRQAPESFDADHGQRCWVGIGPISIEWQLRHPREENYISLSKDRSCILPYSLPASLCIIFHRAFLAWILSNPFVFKNTGLHTGEDGVFRAVTKISSPSVGPVACSRPTTTLWSFILLAVVLVQLPSSSRN
jgi:hypothetical protein